MKRLFLLTLVLFGLIGKPAVADPVHANPPGINDNGAGQYITACDMYAPITISASGLTQVIAAPGAGLKIHICHFDWVANGSTTVQFEYGTGTNCGTGTGSTNMPAPYPATAETGIAAGSGIGQLFAVPAANALCINNGSAVSVSGLIAYTLF